MARVLVTRPLPGPALGRLSTSGHAVVILPGPQPPTAAELAERLRDDRVEGLLCMLTERIDERLLAAAPALRAISTYAVGTDNIDLAACAARGIPVGHTPDVLTEATADLAWALLLAGARRLSEGIDAVRDGDWSTWRPDWLLGRDLHGGTLGVIGFGRIGRAIAQRAAGFDMTVLRTSRSGDDPDAVPLDELLRRSDAISVSVPLTPTTRHLIDARALALVQPHAVLVNTARGPIVDQDALAAALHERRLFAAALDVTDPEPLPPDHPLLSAPGITVLPHLGSATEQTRAAMAELAVDNLLAGLDGRLLPAAATA